MPWGVKIFLSCAVESFLILGFIVQKLTQVMNGTVMAPCRSGVH